MALQPRLSFLMTHPNFWINLPLLRHCCNGKGRPGRLADARRMSSSSNVAALTRSVIPPETLIPHPSVPNKQFTFYRKAKRKRPSTGTPPPSQSTSREQESFKRRIPLNLYISGDRLVSPFYYYKHPNKRSSGYSIPSNTKGVFYYHRRPDQPPASGELRFRLCTTTEQFNEGQDLMLRDVPLPWNLSIYTLARDRRWRDLLKLLLQEKLVDEALVQDMKNIRMDKPHRHYPWISLLDQPFVIDLAVAKPIIALLSRHDFRLLRFQNIFWDPHKELSPYTGRILARLEFSNNLRHINRAYVVLRILEVLTPIECIVHKYNGHVARPVPSELYSTKSRHGIGYIAWAVPVDAGHGEEANKAPLARFLDSLRDEGFKAPKPKFYVDLDNTPIEVISESES